MFRRFGPADTDRMQRLMQESRPAKKRATPQMQWQGTSGQSHRDAWMDC